jgi:hypothetical protein
MTAAASAASHKPFMDLGHLACRARVIDLVVGWNYATVKVRRVIEE